MAAKPLKQVKAKPAKSRETAALAREPAAAALISKRIEEDIVLGRRHPRERLIEQDLSDLFRTHRGDVRLALLELERKGLIDRIPNRGAMVRGLTPHEVREIYAVREELEVMAVRIIPFPIPSREISRLEELHREHSAAVASGDLLTVFYSNLSFHQTLFGLCGNSCLIETIDQLAQKVYGIRFYANALPESLDRARLDHLKMIDDYIRTFSECLEKFTFTWLGRKGPCPVSLAADPLFAPPRSSRKLFNEVTSPMSPLPPAPHHRDGAGA